MFTKSRTLRFVTQPRWLVALPVLMLTTLLGLPYAASAQVPDEDGLGLVLGPAIKALTDPNAGELQPKGAGNVGDDTQLIAAAYARRAGDYYTVGDTGHAIRDISRAINLAPAFQEAYLFRGAVYCHQAMYGRALPDINRAVALDPKDKQALICRAAIYANLHRAGAATEDATAALALDPDGQETYVLHVMRGAFELMQNQDDAAIRDATEAIDTSMGQDEQQDFIFQIRASAYIKRGEYDAAISDCAQAISLDPKEAASYQLRAAAYTLKGDKAAALDTAKARSLH